MILPFLLKFAYITFIINIHFRTLVKGFMKRDDLTHLVRERLKRLPSPYNSHYGVVPLPPPEDGIPLTAVSARLSAANTALARIDMLAAELKDPYLISRILPRREAV